jgi:hypothetical protein
MWIVQLALRRPYTFVVMAMLIAIMGVVSIFRMPTDIFPEIDIPVVAVIWTYTGISPDEMETRVVGNYERVLVSTVNGIEHIESQSLKRHRRGEDFLARRGPTSTAPSRKSSLLRNRFCARCRRVSTRRWSCVTTRQMCRLCKSRSVATSSRNNSSSTTRQPAYAPAWPPCRGRKIPYPYGGKVRQIMVDIDPREAACLETFGRRYLGPRSMRRI